MAGTLQYAGNVLAKAVAVKAGKALLKKGNFLKMGIGFGAVAAVGAGYWAYKACTKKTEVNKSGSKKIVI